MSTVKETNLFLKYLGALAAVFKSEAVEAWTLKKHTGESMTPRGNRDAVLFEEPDIIVVFIICLTTLSLIPVNRNY